MYIIYVYIYMYIMCIFTYVCVVHAKLINGVFCVSDSTDQSMSAYVGSFCNLTNR